MSNKFNNNAVAFLGLCVEYCRTLENAREMTGADFVSAMLKLLPRIYISVSDLDIQADDDVNYIENRLEEDYYDSIRRGIENLLGPDDTYLEVFEEDMKYSDTPIAASVSEELADLFQVFYDCIEAMKDVPDDIAHGVLASVKEDFGSYWSRILCNVLRPLNAIKFYGLESEEK